MDHTGHVAAAAREVDELLAALAAGPLSAPVPTCPDWTAADLTSHVGWFCTRWRDHLRGGGHEDDLHGTDDPSTVGAIGAEWFVRLEADRPVVTREHAKGDLALRAAVSDLELLLYGRPPLGEVQRFGDESILDLWHRLFRFSREYGHSP